MSVSSDQHLKLTSRAFSSLQEIRELSPIKYQENVAFMESTGTLQVKYRELHQAGIGAVVIHAPLVSKEKDALWLPKAIGYHDPLLSRGLFFFYLGKAFCLRGGEEKRNLKPSQATQLLEPDCYDNVENGQSGVNAREKNKIVPVYANHSACPRCLAYLLYTYFSKFHLTHRIRMSSTCTLSNHLTQTDHDMNVVIGLCACIVPG